MFEVLHCCIPHRPRCSSNGHTIVRATAGRAVLLQFRNAGRQRSFCKAPLAKPETVDTWLRCGGDPLIIRCGCRSITAKPSRLVGVR